MTSIPTIAIISRAGTGIENAVRNNYVPMGDHVLIPPDAQPQYQDESGNLFHFIQARNDVDVNGDTLLDALSGLENTPHVRLFVAQEQVHVDDIDGRRVIWQVGNQALVEVTPRSVILEGLEPVEVEFSTLDVEPEPEVEPDEPEPEPDDRINVNTATENELRTLPGVGPSLARRIIDDRPYEAVDDLTRVQGISQDMVDGWGDEATV